MPKTLTPKVSFNNGPPVMWTFSSKSSSSESSGSDVGNRATRHSPSQDRAKTRSKPTKNRGKNPCEGSFPLSLHQKSTNKSLDGDIPALSYYESESLGLADGANAKRPRRSCIESSGSGYDTDFLGDFESFAVRDYREHQ